jgi:hypothetical protein
MTASLKRRDGFIPAILLFAISLTVLLKTIAPTVYTLDSGEFVIAARYLGFAHGPGYPLYLLILHAFLHLPIGDLGFRGNLLSALCLAGSVPILFTLLKRRVGSAWIAAASSLLFAWSYYVWFVGLFTEVYAPQMFTVALLGWALCRMPAAPTRWQDTFIPGAAFGLAVAICPSSIFLAAGVVLTYLHKRVSWPRCIVAGIVAAALFLSTQLYFPWRYDQQPDFSLAGQYQADGSFRPVPLDTLAGISWFISGGQFRSLFFQDGLLPSGQQIAALAGLFNSNFLGVGLALGVIGASALYQQNKTSFGLWLAFFAPYTYFYSTYGAGDKALMFGPSFLVWTILIAFGLRWLKDRFQPARANLLLMLLPVLLLAFYFPRVDLSGETSARQRAEAVMRQVPAEAIILGQWHDIVPVQYLYYVEGKRPDLRLYNLFLFPTADLRPYLDRATAAGAPVIFISSRLRPDGLPGTDMSWILSRYRAQKTTLAFGDDPPLDLFLIQQP